MAPFFVSVRHPAFLANLAIVASSVILAGAFAAAAAAAALALAIAAAAAAASAASELELLSAVCSGVAGVLAVSEACCAVAIPLARAIAPARNSGRIFEIMTCCPVLWLFVPHAHTRLGKHALCVAADSATTAVLHCRIPRNLQLREVSREFLFRQAALVRKSRALNGHFLA